MDKEKLEEFIIKASKIKLITIGVDGVLTDAGMYFSPDGDIIRKFNRRDGMGIQILKTSGIKTAVISSVESTIRGATCERRCSGERVQITPINAGKCRPLVEKLTFREECLRLPSLRSKLRDQSRPVHFAR